MKKLLSILLTLALCVGLMPAVAVPVHAATATVNVAVTDVADGEMIEGAILQIYKQSDTETVLWEWPSTEEEHQVTGLETDVEYVLHETVAPDGYILASDTTFIIDETGRVTSTGTMTTDGTLLVENAKTSVLIKKVKAADNTALEGATLQILDPDGNILEEWVSETDAHGVTGLLTGITYTIRETVAPEGYETAADSTFTISTSGTISYSGTTTTESSNVVLLVKNEPEPVKYDLYIAGIQVTERNLVIDSADNANITSGSATYDPSTQTLTLNGFNWTGRSKALPNDAYTAIRADQDLTINVVGTNNLLMDVEVSSRNNSFITIWADNHKITFEGSGTLTLGTKEYYDVYHEGTSAAILADEVECSENFSGLLQATEPNNKAGYNYGILTRTNMTVNGGTVYIKGIVYNGNWARGLETKKLIVKDAVVRIECETTLNMPAIGLYNTGGLPISVLGSGELYVDANKEDDNVGTGGATALYTDDVLNVHVDDNAKLQIGGRALTAISMRYGMNAEGPMTVSGKTTLLHCNYSRMDPDVRFVGSVSAYTTFDGSDTATPIIASGYLSRFDNYKRLVTTPAGTSYPIYVGGFQVTENNAADVLGDGTVSYDASTKTLTLDGANITGSYLYDCSTNYTYDHHNDIWCSLYAEDIPDLTVYVKSDSTITAPTKMGSLNSGEISLDRSYGVFLHSYDSNTGTGLNAELKLDADLTVVSETIQGMALDYYGRELTISGSSTLDLSTTGTEGRTIYSSGNWQTNAITLTDSVAVNVDSQYYAIMGNDSLGLTIGKDAGLSVSSASIGVYELRELVSNGTVTIISTGGNGSAINQSPVNVNGGSFTASGTTSALLYSPSKIIAAEGMIIFAGDSAASATQQDGSTYTGNAKYVTVKEMPSVKIVPGSNMTKTTDSGEASQFGLTGAMTDVVYIADKGYYFPTDYAVAAVSGVSVIRDNYTQITVSGTPTAAVNITLPAPTQKVAASTPTSLSGVDCTTTANNDGQIVGADSNMEYRKDGETAWTSFTGTSATGLTPGTYYVRVKETETALVSAEVSVTIAEYNAPKYAIIVDGGSAQDGAGNTITQAVEGETVKIVYSVPDGKKFDHWEFISGITSADLTNDQFTMPAVAVSLKAVFLDIAPAPVITPDSQSFSETLDVTITCALDGATVYYTMDGNDPDPASSSVTTGAAITIDATATFKAMAVKAGYANSDIATATYTKTTPSTGGGGGGATTYPVTPAEAENGKITVSPKNAAEGDRVTITVTPDEGYELDKLTVKDKDGNEINAKDNGDGTFTIEMPASEIAVEATFKEAEETPGSDDGFPFVDVPEDAYYRKPVEWAVENGITSGVSEDKYGPELSCTRAQVVTFLWITCGSEDAGTETGFDDVDVDAYYDKAVAWAVEKGITAGTSENEFSPEMTVTRAQFVTMLWVANGMHEVDGEMPFKDVPQDSYYAKAVAWAYANDITAGKSADSFAPDDPCTRGQIMTFLYNAYAE